MTYESLLHAILGKVRDVEPGKRSQAAQDAHDACAFLQACAESRLAYYLGTQPTKRLLTACAALAAIGVDAGAEILARRPTSLRQGGRASVQSQARQIEEDVAASSDKIFAELTRYAAFGCMADPDFFKRP